MGKPLNMIKHLKKSNMFPHTIGVQSVVSSTYKGAKTPGASVNRKARLAGKNILVKDEHGKDVVSKLHAVFAGHFGLVLTDTFTLPSGYIPQIVRPIDIQEGTDESVGGKHHQTVFF